MPFERRINLRFSADRFDKLDEKRFQARTTFQEIGARLFEEWLTGERLEMKPPEAKHDPLLEKLEMIRASGDAELNAMVRKAIELSFAILKRSLTAEELERLRASSLGPPRRHRGSLHEEYTVADEDKTAKSA